MMFSIVMLYVMIQASAAYRSTADCSATSVVPALPLLTRKQIDELYMLSQELDKLSCQELQERVYSTTEPPIQISDDQIDELRIFYPDFFKNDTGGEAIGIAQCNNNQNGNSSIVNVCSFSIVRKQYYLALDKDGNPVYVPQPFGVEQVFDEHQCTGTACVSSLQCQCESQLSYTGKAVVSYINGNDSKFYITDIQLYSCEGYVSV